jgi:hypothetical protein
MSKSMQPKIPLPAPAPQEGRHAGVVPSFAIQCFSPVIKSSAGDFKRESLLAWSEPLPTQLVAKAIREVLVETKAWAEENDNGVGFSKVPTGVRPPMARSNSPTLGHPKFPQAGPVRL